jgi:hypothetical protein
MLMKQGVIPAFFDAFSLLLGLLVINSDYTSINRQSPPVEC